jgi:LAS superfamily LD-carboxypeptidase LdcB
MKLLCLVALAACVIGVFGRRDAPARHVTLDPQLRRAVEAATRDAARAGITVKITSGVRTAAHQQRLLDEAIETYGSEAVARRYVNTPERSTHVTGKAVDIGPTDAAYWMAQHGADYGLCQIYANEVWHYERVTEPGGTCPPQRPDASG